MRRASYREAIKWMAYNDDTEWAEDEVPIPSVTAALIADLFDVSTETVTADLLRQMTKMQKERGL